MKLVAYIKSLNGFPIDETALSAYLGFKYMMIDTVFYEDLEEVPTSKYNILVAGIGETNNYFSRFGIPEKLEMNIPRELLKYAGRQIDYMTMGEFKKNVKAPIFVKSNNKSKFFPSGVIQREESKDFFLNEVPDDFPVMTSEVLDIVVEYRGYVVNRELKGIYFYLGDFRKFVDCSIVDAAIADFTEQPAGYSIDFGLTRDGKTVLIECNDGWSLGNYGLEHSKYASLLKRRWLEIFKAY